MRIRYGLILVLACAIVLVVFAGTPDAKKHVDKNKVVATRVHFSGNMEGELDPCG